MNSSPPQIAVFGSLNIDHNYLVEHIPVAGETVSSRGVVRHFGGKGANQAVAAARAGGVVTLAGAVGCDADGEAYLAALEKNGVRPRISQKQGWPTGSAVILSAQGGENLIVVEAGANAGFRPDDVAAAYDSLEQVDVVLLQLECPLETVQRAAQLGRQRGATVIVNPSPWTDEFLDAAIPCDVLVVNETEARGLGDRALALCNHLITTRGAAPTACRNVRGESWEVPAFSVSVTDTVGAGDTFAGALAVALGEGHLMPEAIRFANAAGALATAKLGAQSAMPSRDEIEKLLGR